MEFDSAIRGHHIYKDIWPNPNIGKQLHCKMEHGNIHDMYAVAITRDREDVVVGHLPSPETSLRHAICFYAKVAIYRVLLMELGDFLPTLFRVAWKFRAVWSSRVPLETSIK